MAVGDKKPVVMEADRAVPGGIATLGTDGKLSSEQIPDMEALGAIEYINSLPFTRKNLLDNWYFPDPIDQRGGYVVPPGQKYFDVNWTAEMGTTDTYYPVKRWVQKGNLDAIIEVNGVEYIVSHNVPVRGYVGAEYGIDRWRNANSLTTTLVEEDGLVLSSSTDAYAYTDQIIEFPERFFGKTITVSALVDGKLIYGTGDLPASLPSSITNYIYEENNTNTFALCVQGITSIGLYVRLCAKNSKFLAAKLELGSTQTLAHQDENGNWVLNDPPPNKALELAKCQRYQWVPHRTDDAAASVTVVKYSDNGHWLEWASSIMFPATLRAYPTIKDCEILINNVWRGFEPLWSYANKDGMRLIVMSNGYEDLVDSVWYPLRFIVDAKL